MEWLGQSESSSVSAGRESESESNPRIQVGQVFPPVGSSEGGQSRAGFPHQQIQSQLCSSFCL